MLKSTTEVAAARRRVAMRLLPFLFVLYVISFIDRTNISVAAVDVSRDLGFTDGVLGLGFGVFFLGYIVLEIPGALIVERWSARKWFARIMVTWGAVTLLMAFIHTPSQFYWVRFLLGIAEAGFFPGVLVYLSHWFLYEDRAKAIAKFMAAIPVSSVVGSVIASLLLGVHWFGLQGWRWLFLVEGVPAIVMGVITWFYLPDWPRDAKWMPEDERAWLTNALAEESTAKRRSSGSWTRSMGNVLLMAASYLLTNAVGYGIQLWMPTILQRISGFSTAVIPLLAAIPFAVAFFAMQINGWHSDRTRERRLHAAFPLLFSSLCLLPLIWAGGGGGLNVVNLGTTVTVILFAGVVAGQMAFLPAFWSMPSAILGESSAAAAIGFINGIAMLGAFSGPALVGHLSGQSHSFQSSFIMVSVGYAIAGLILLFVRLRSRIPNSTDLISPTR